MNKFNGNMEDMQYASLKGMDASAYNEFDLNLTIV